MTQWFLSGNVVLPYRGALGKSGSFSKMVTFFCLFFHDALAALEAARASRKKQKKVAMLEMQICRHGYL